MIQADRPRDSSEVHLVSSEFGSVSFSEMAQPQVWGFFIFILTVVNLIRKFISVISVIIKLTQPLLMKEGIFYIKEMGIVQSPSAGCNCYKA